MHWEAEIKYLRVALQCWDQVELGDALGGPDRAGLGIYLEPGIELNSEIHLDAVIERLLRCTWRP